MPATLTIQAGNRAKVRNVPQIPRAGKAGKITQVQTLKPGEQSATIVVLQMDATGDLCEYHVSQLEAE